MKILEEEPATILEIIGENNVDCIKVFKYIVNSCNSTPINAGISQRQQNTPSTQGSTNLADSVINYNNSIEKNSKNLLGSASANENQVAGRDSGKLAQMNPYDAGNIQNSGFVSGVT